MWVEYRNVQPLGDGRYDCEINHPEFGWIPFTANPDDVEPHGYAVWLAIKDHGVLPDARL
jgi:hypothetical protein